ncbi:MAG: peptidylprolyl isomerase [Gammaproteobacteria bacterium]|nr:peptidylprolyl isomerase [Gammaproteobacteria bacterium]
MNIAKDSVVKLHYTLKDDSGEKLDHADESEPLTYLHGHKNLLEGLEAALEGKAAGDQVEVNLAAAQAFGEYSEDSEQRIPLKHLNGASKWEPGMTATVHAENGRHQVTVLKVGHTMATIDANHPMAGKALHFNVDVVEVRQATAEELSHGHAHGPGGHQH